MNLIITKANAIKACVHFQKKRMALETPQKTILGTLDLPKPADALKYDQLLSIEYAFALLVDNPELREL